jgi:hypothetical protein
MRQRLNDRLIHRLVERRHAGGVNIIHLDGRPAAQQFFRCAADATAIITVVIIKGFSQNAWAQVSVARFQDGELKFLA